MPGCSLSQEETYLEKLKEIRDELRDVADGYHLTLRNVFADLSYVVIAEDILDTIQNDK